MSKDPTHVLAGSFCYGIQLGKESLNGSQGEVDNEQDTYHPHQRVNLFELTAR